ncbi:MAG: family 16 glycoside hydrolase [Planctomycetota bacterium]|jgi:hypothetical protein
MNASSARFVPFAAIASLLSVFAVSCAQQQRSRELNIADTPGRGPKMWTIDETNGRGKPAKWEVIKDDSAPGNSPVIAITKNKNRGHTYNLLLAKNKKVRDVEFEAKVKAISGKEDQGGGLIWRVVDPNNYYLARWNPLEGNFRLYVVRHGKRKQLGSIDVTADPKTWHEIEIEHSRDEIDAEFDGRSIEIDDDTLPEAGMVGLWTKADAATAFTEFYFDSRDRYR